MLGWRQSPGGPLPRQHVASIVLLLVQGDVLPPLLTNVPRASDLIREALVWAGNPAVLRLKLTGRVYSTNAITTATASVQDSEVLLGPCANPYMHQAGFITYMHVSTGGMAALLAQDIHKPCRAYYMTSDLLIVTCPLAER